MHHYIVIDARRVRELQDLLNGEPSHLKPNKYEQYALFSVLFEAWAAIDVAVYEGVVDEEQGQYVEAALFCRGNCVAHEVRNTLLGTYSFDYLNHTYSVTLTVTTGPNTRVRGPRR